MKLYEISLFCGWLYLFIFPIMAHNDDEELKKHWFTIEGEKEDEDDDFFSEEIDPEEDEETDSSGDSKDSEDNELDEYDDEDDDQ